MVGRDKTRYHLHPEEVSGVVLGRPRLGLAQTLDLNSSFTCLLLLPMSEVQLWLFLLPSLFRVPLVPRESQAPPDPQEKG